MWRGNPKNERQELFMIILYQVIYVIKSKQELFGEAHDFAFHLFYFVLEFILVVVEALVKVIFLLQICVQNLQ